MTVTRAFIEEATVTPWGMWMGRHLEMTTPTRGFRRIAIFERTWDWGGGAVDLAEAQRLAVAALATIGRRPAGDGGWWRDIVSGDRGYQLRHPVTADTWARLDHEQGSAIPHLYAVLEQIPEWTGSIHDEAKEAYAARDYADDIETKLRRYDPWSDDDRG